MTTAPPTLTGRPLRPGEPVHHRRRRQLGRYVEPDRADPSGETVWVDFGDDGVLMVSVHLLARPT